MYVVTINQGNISTWRNFCSFLNSAMLVGFFTSAAVMEDGRCFYDFYSAVKTITLISAEPIYSGTNETLEIAKK